MKLKTQQERRSYKKASESSKVVQYIQELPIGHITKREREDQSNI